MASNHVKREHSHALLDSKAERRTLKQAGESTPACALLTNQPSLTQTRAIATQHLVVIDSGIEDYPFLRTAVLDDVKVVVLQPNQNGIQQITGALRQNPSITHLHIVSHGSPGCLYLGNTKFNLATLKDYAADLKTCFSGRANSPLSLSLYGCKVAADESGIAFIEELHHLTGAGIAATTTLTGHATRGGNWELDLQMGNPDPILPFCLETLVNYSSVLVVPIDTNGLIAAYQDLPDDRSGDYSAPESGDADGDGRSNELYRYQFRAGTDNDLKLTGFKASPNGGPSLTFNLLQLGEKVTFRRIDNAAVNDGSTTDATVFERNIFLYEIEALNTTANTLDLKPPRLNRMEEAVSTSSLNRGVDNIFANTGGNNVNNIERIDYVIPGGFSATAPNLDDIGFLLLERGGNDPLKIAAITAIDQNGNPTKFGSLVEVAANKWGASQFRLDTVVMSEVTPGSTARFVDRIDAQRIGGVYISFKAFGIRAEQTFFGYALFPGDITASNDLLNLSDFPLNTAAQSGRGGLDLVGGGGVYARSDINIAPILNLDPINLSGGDDDRNFQATSVNGATTNLTTLTASAFDPNNGGRDIELLTISLTGILNGANERLNFNGVAAPLVDGTAITTLIAGTTLAIAISGTNLTVRNQAGGAIANDVVSELLRTLTYSNAVATAGDRVFQFVANDGEADSNRVTSTITVTGSATAPPTLDLDGNNSSGVVGADFQTSFTENGPAVAIADLDTLITDADSPTLAAATLTLTNARDTDTLVVGSLPAGLTAALNTSIPGQITVTLSGQATPADYQTALGTIAFQTGGDAPDPTDRIVTVSVSDGSNTSNLATSRVRVIPTPDAVDDTATGQEDTPLLIPVLTNDDQGAGTVTVSVSQDSQPTNGTVRTNADGTITYTPNSGFEGRDRFIYTITDRNGNRSSATVTLLITPKTIIQRDRNAIINGFSDRDVLRGTSGNDVLNGGSSADILWGEAGDDILNGGSNHDEMYGGPGNDSLDGGTGDDRIWGNDGNDTINGGSGRDYLRGDDGDDLLTGGDGQDRIFGNNGRDILRGDQGNDILDGGAGIDILAGGQGKDRFVFQSVQDFGDRITDFEIIGDRLDLSAIRGITSLADLRFRQRGGDALILGLVGNRFQTIAVLEDVQASTLDRRHFMF